MQLGLPFSDETRPGAAGPPPPDPDTAVARLHAAPVPLVEPPLAASPSAGLPSPAPPPASSSASLTTASLPTASLPTASPGAAPPATAPPSAGIYYVRHKRARRYLLRVDTDGRIRVTIPRGGSQKMADAFALRHADWIERQRARLTQPVVDADERRALRVRARAELPPRLLALARQHDLVVSKVSIRNQRTRWGSCGRDGHISLNWRLLLMPAHVCDYVLVHELMHLRRMDHSPAYWRLVAAACPGHREARGWLRQHGPSLR